MWVCRHEGRRVGGAATQIALKPAPQCRRLKSITHIIIFDFGIIPIAAEDYFISARAGLQHRQECLGLWQRHSCLRFGAQAGMPVSPWGFDWVCHLGGLIGHNDRSVQPRRARGTVSTLRGQQTARPTAAPCRRLNDASARVGGAVVLCVSPSLREILNNYIMPEA